GPVLDNVQVLAGTGGPYSWTTMPERLQRHGVSWKAYQTIGTGPETQFADNPLPLFAQFQDPRSELYRNAFLPSFPGEFEADVAAGTLPSVSWVYAPPLADEHPPSPSAYGEVFLSRVFAALTSNPKVWAKTVWFVTFDENGGFFDHVPPAVPPPGTRGEYLTT